MADATFDDFFGWVMERKGEEVHLEVGTDDPDSSDPAVAIAVSMHVTVEDIRSGDDMHRDRMVLSVKLGGGERNRLFFDPERVTRVQIHGGAARAWIHGSFYVALSGGRGS